MFWSKLCKSGWNWAWNLAFPVFISPIVWNMCENLHYEWVSFKELHNEQEYCWPTKYRAGVFLVEKFKFFSLFVFGENKTKNKKTKSSVFHTYSKPRNKHHRLEGLLRFKKPIISRKLYIVFQSWLLSSRLKLCEPARFSNISITCPKICCDVGRKKEDICI